MCAATMPTEDITKKSDKANGHALPSPPIIVCTKCGATTEAACMCAAPYMPARKRAEKAIADNPGLSNRAIARKTGVALETVRRTRNLTDPNGSVARIGSDGKMRRPPKPKPSDWGKMTPERKRELSALADELNNNPDPYEMEYWQEQHRTDEINGYRVAMLLRANEAARLAFFPFETDILKQRWIKELANYCDKVADRWKRLAEDFRTRRKK